MADRRHPLTPSHFTPHLAQQATCPILSYTCIQPSLPPQYFFVPYLSFLLSPLTYITYTYKSLVWFIHVTPVTLEGRRGEKSQLSARRINPPPPLFQLCPDVCVQKWRTWVLFQLQGSEMSENSSLRMGVKVAASLDMGKNLWVLDIALMSYNYHKLSNNNQKMMDCEWPLGMIHFSLILHHNMEYAEELTFNTDNIFYLRRPWNWVHFQTPNTHIRPFLYCMFILEPRGAGGGGGGIKHKTPVCWSKGP